MPVMFWLFVAIFCAAVEGFTVSLVAVWFTGGALIAMLVSAAGGGLVMQILLFCAASAVFIALLRPFIRKYHKTVPTNADALIGKTAVVTEGADGVRACGRVTVDGMDWAAKSGDGSRLKKGASVTITAIEGAKLMVIETENAKKQEADS